MSIDTIRAAFMHMEEIKDWEMFAVHYKNNSKDIIEYESYPVHFTNRNALLELAKLNVNTFLDVLLPERECVEKYNPYNSDKVIHCIELTDIMIGDSIQKLHQSLNTPNDTTPIEKSKANCYLIRGSYENENSEQTIISLIILQTPFYNYKRKKNVFRLYETELKELTEPLFNFSNYFDMFIIGEKLYLLNFKGEKFLNLEKSYKKKCNDKLDEISKMNLIENFPDFALAASSGYNPRRFVTFCDQKLIALKTISNRTKVANKLGIPLNHKNQFIVTDEKLIERLVKTLCDKTRTDFMDNDTLCEVPASKPLE